MGSTAFERVQKAFERVAAHSNALTGNAFYSEFRKYEAEDTP
jgi:hypothetical protein